MAVASIAVLVLLALYLGRRWQLEVAENTDLRAQIAALKRKLARWGR